MRSPTFNMTVLCLAASAAAAGRKPKAFWAMAAEMPSFSLGLERQSCYLPRYHYLESEILDLEHRDGRRNSPFRRRRYRNPAARDFSRWQPSFDLRLLRKNGPYRRRLLWHLPRVLFRLIDLAWSRRSCLPSSIVAAFER